MFSQCFCDLCTSQGCCANIRVCWTETGHTSARGRRVPRLGEGGDNRLSAPCCNSLYPPFKSHKLVTFLFFYVFTVLLFKNCGVYYDTVDGNAYFIDEF